MKEIILNLWPDNWLERALIVLMLLVFSLIPFGIYAIIEEAKQWEEFKVINNCKVVSRVKGHSSTDVGYGMTTTGQMGTIITTNTVPDKTQWSCDDGVTYWR